MENIVRARDENLVQIRQEIVSMMRARAAYVTSAEIQELTGNKYTADQIGNNLRILREQGVAASTKIDGKSHWILTGKEFVAKPPMRMLIPFPNEVHENLASLAEKQGISKNSLVIKIISDFFAEAIDS